MLIAASCPSKSEAAVTKRNLCFVWKSVPETLVSAGVGVDMESVVSRPMVKGMKGNGGRRLRFTDHAVFFGFVRGKSADLLLAAQGLSAEPLFLQFAQ